MDFAADVTSLAALSEPVRRELYRFVVAQARPVSREEAAAGVGVAHHVAKFNLDKLVVDGLLDVEYRRPPGRGGPGAGRPAKLYRRGARAIEVSLPERHYDLAGRVLAEAFTIAARDAVPVGEALHAAATAAGQEIGAAASGGAASGGAASGGEAAARGASVSGGAAASGGSVSGGAAARGGSASGGAAAARGGWASGGAAAARGASLEAVGRVLARHGYEPRVSGDRMMLGNCPFHSLAGTYTDLVCGMNLDLIGGVIDRVCPGRLSAHLDPGPDRCCVAILPAD